MPLIKTSVLLPAISNLCLPSATPSISRLIRADEVEAVSVLASLHAEAPIKLKNKEMLAILEVVYFLCYT